MQRGVSDVPPTAHLYYSLPRRLVSCFSLLRFLRVILRGESEYSQIVIMGHRDLCPLLNRFRHPACGNLLLQITRPHPSHQAWVPFACPYC